MPSFNRLLSFFPVIAILALGLSIPLQAQVTWQTTATTINGYNSGACTLNNGTLRVKVFPSYLDVEEDVEIGTSGTVTTGNDPSTLEIVANFSLPSGATIIGALLWNGEQILQGKLLDRATADSIYEDLVDRNSTPPVRPRDPVIIELTGTNTYRLRVYPVALGHSRHFRLRYQLPPKIGVDGFEMRLQAAIIPLISPSTATVTVNLTGGNVDSILYVESGLKRALDLPRSLFVARSALTASAAAGTSALRILPIDPARQVMVKTSFSNGNFAGNYLNLYAGISEDLFKQLGQRIEVVIFWKWHNPATWIQRSYGSAGVTEQVTSYVTTAQSQASQILSLYGSLGVPGNRVGLLHDNSKSTPRTFPVASNTEASYQQAMDYLRSVQGSYAEQFARSIQVLPNNSTPPNIQESKNRFMDNIRLVKTLYSPEQGITRHLIVVSVGPEFSNSDLTLNDSLEQIFEGQMPSLSTMKSWSFDQVGFDLWQARTSHSYAGTLFSTAYADVPGFSAMNVVMTVRNDQRSYDFTVACAAGLSLNCGSAEFHGKSDYPWHDTLEWSLYQSNGTLLGHTSTSPRILDSDGDTATAVLWAGSAAPFSEKKELPLGPVYGFVDKWANLLALENDEAGLAYADSGVPRISNENINDVIPNYDESQTTSCPTCAPITPILDVLKAAMRNPALWRIERGRDGLLFVRIQGLTANTQVELQLLDLNGKRLGIWNLRSDAGFLRWNVAGIRPGAYLLRVRVNGIEGIKRIVL